MILRYIWLIPLVAQFVRPTSSPVKIQSINVNCQEDGMGVDIQFDQPFHGVIFSKNHFSTAGCSYINNPGRDRVQFTIRAGQCGTVRGPPALADASGKRTRRDLGHFDSNSTANQNRTGRMYDFDFGSIDRMLSFGMPMGGAGGGRRGGMGGGMDSMYENSREDQPPAEAMEFIGQPQQQQQGMPDQGAQFAGQQVGSMQNQIPGQANQISSAGYQLSQNLNNQFNQAGQPLYAATTGINGQVYPSNPNAPTSQISFSGAPQPPNPYSPYGSQAQQAYPYQNGALNGQYTGYGQQPNQYGQTYQPQQQYRGSYNVPTKTIQIDPLTGEEVTTTQMPIDDEPYVLPDNTTLKAAPDAEIGSFGAQSRSLEAPMAPQSGYAQMPPAPGYPSFPQAPNHQSYMQMPQQQMPYVPQQPQYPSFGHGGQQSNILQNSQMGYQPDMGQFQQPQMPQMPNMPGDSNMGGYGQGMPQDMYMPQGPNMGGNQQFMPEPPAMPDQLQMMGGMGHNNAYSGGVPTNNQYNNVGEKGYRGGESSVELKESGSGLVDVKLTKKTTLERTTKKPTTRATTARTTTEEILEEEEEDASYGAVPTVKTTTRAPTTTRTTKKTTTTVAYEDEEYEEEETTKATTKTTTKPTTKTTTTKKTTAKRPAYDDEEEEEEEQSGAQSKSLEKPKSSVSLPAMKATLVEQEAKIKGGSSSSSSSSASKSGGSASLVSSSSAGSGVETKQRPPSGPIPEGTVQAPASGYNNQPKDEYDAKYDSAPAQAGYAKEPQGNYGKEPREMQEPAFGYKEPAFGYQEPAGMGYKEPGFGYNEPKFGYQEPSFGYREPAGMGYKEPGFGYKEPAGMGYQEPGFGYKEPAGMGYQEPAGMGYKEPAGMGYKEPGFGYKEPAGMGYQEPGFGYKEPAGMGYQEPTGMGYKEPAGMGYKEPGFGYKEPAGMGYQEPTGMGYREPAGMGYKEPAGMGYQEPGFGYKEPAGMGYQEPTGMGYKEPAGMGYKEPGFGYKEPAGMGYQEPAGMGYQEPAGMGYKEPNMGYKEPAGMGYQEPAGMGYKEPAGLGYREPNMGGNQHSGQAGWGSAAASGNMQAPSVVGSQAQIRTAGQNAQSQQVSGQSSSSGSGKVFGDRHGLDFKEGPSPAVSIDSASSIPSQTNAIKSGQASASGSQLSSASGVSKSSSGSSQTEGASLPAMQARLPISGAQSSSQAQNNQRPSSVSSSAAAPGSGVNAQVKSSASASSSSSASGSKVSVGGSVAAQVASQNNAAQQVNAGAAVQQARTVATTSASTKQRFAAVQTTTVKSFAAVQTTTVKSDDDEDEDDAILAPVKRPVAQKGASSKAMTDDEEAGDGGYIENVIIIQNDPLVQEVTDAARAIRCEWRSNYKKTVKSKERIALTDVQTMRFAGDDIEVWMEIQAGKGPWADPVSNIVPIGQTMTLLIGANDPKHEFDLRVGRCIAHDGQKAQIDLTDDNGCVIRDRIIGSFDKARDWGAEKATIAFAHFSAFKFPETTKVYIECDVEVCKRGCQPQCTTRSPLTPKSASSMRKVGLSSSDSTAAAKSMSSLANNKLGQRTRQKRSVKATTDHLSVYNHYESVSPADLSMTVMKALENQTAPIVYAGIREDAGHYCLSRGGFGVALGLSLFVIIVTTITSTVLCLRYRNKRPKVLLMDH